MTTVSASEVKITSRQYWFKIVEFLQQNWALIDPTERGVIVYFFGDTSGVFDEISFNSQQEAEAALRRNGFRLYTEDAKVHEFIAAPNAPFTRRPHSNGPIYSSGRYWR
jgi:hypothetical protein